MLTIVLFILGLGFALVLLLVIARFIVAGLAGIATTTVVALSVPDPEGALIGLLAGVCATIATWRATRHWWEDRAAAASPEPKIGSREAPAASAGASAKPRITAERDTANLALLRGASPQPRSPGGLGARADAAWRILDELSGGRPSIEAARDACAQFLRRAADAAPDPEHLALAIAIRDNLPDLVERTLRLPSGTADRTVADRRLLDTAALLGERAAEATNRLTRPDRDALAAAQAHLDAKLRRATDFS